MRLTSLMLLPVCFLLAGCDERDTAKISKVGNQALHKAEALASEASEKLGLPNSVTQRVQQRLSWDKHLDGAKIEVHGDARKITLTGTLKTDDQRQRAVSLAEATVGVKEVTDKLTMP